MPFGVLAFMSESFVGSLLFFLVPAFFGGFYLGPGFSIIQSLSPVRMRAVTEPVSLFVANLIGLGFGLQLMGILSDFFAAEHGSDSLRYALAIFVCINLWAAAHYLLATRTLRQDLANAATR